MNDHLPSKSNQHRNNAELQAMMYVFSYIVILVLICMFLSGCQTTHSSFAKKLSIKLLCVVCQTMHTINTNCFRCDDIAWPTERCFMIDAIVYTALPIKLFSLHSTQEYRNTVLDGNLLVWPSSDLDPMVRLYTLFSSPLRLKNLCCSPN